jgi:hypothetical protein
LPTIFFIIFNFEENCFSSLVRFVWQWMDKTPKKKHWSDIMQRGIVLADYESNIDEDYQGQA